MPNKQEWNWEFGIHNTYGWFFQDKSMDKEWAFNNWIVKTTKNICKNMNLEPLPHLTQKFKSTWITYWNVKSWNYKYLKKTQEENIFVIWGWQSICSHMILKVPPIKKKKEAGLCLSFKKTLLGSNEEMYDEEKILQIMYLIRNWYPTYTKNS